MAILPAAASRNPNWEGPGSVCRLLEQADVFRRICRSSAILPLWILLILIYRDIAVAYIRVMVSREQVLMPARVSGKLKAWVYAFAGIGGIVVFSLRSSAWLSASLRLSFRESLSCFSSLRGCVRVWSLADYAFFSEEISEN